jgi:NADH-quinone oxidoreductase subunit G
LLPRIEGGEIRALVAVEADPLGRYPDRDRIESALRQLELLVVLDYLDTDSAAAADVFLPSTTVFETGGTWINQEGRIQTVQGVYRGGIPVSQTGGGSHPPRVFMLEVPGGQAAASGETLMRLSPADDEKASEWLRLPPYADKPSGLRALLPEPGEHRFAPERAAGSGAAGDEATLTVIAVESAFGTEVLSSRSPWLSSEETVPSAWLHPEDAGRVPLSDGDLLEIDAGGESLVLPVKIAENMARRTLVIPRHPDVAWQRLGGTRLRIGWNRIRKAQPSGEAPPVNESPPRRRTPNRADD